MRKLMFCARTATQLLLPSYKISPQRISRSYARIVARKMISSPRPSRFRRVTDDRCRSTTMLSDWNPRDGTGEDLQATMVGVMTFFR